MRLRGGLERVGRRGVLAGKEHISHKHLARELQPGVKSGGHQDVL